MSAAQLQTLLIESGNSSWKAAQAQTEGLNFCGRGADFSSLRAWLQQRPERKIVLATVGAEQEAVSLVSELQNDGYEIYRVQTGEITDFTHCYANPERLGVDRWLTMVALRHRPLPVLVIDAGTAVTFDVLQVGGIHLGGWIAPGFMLMQEALIRRSSRLSIHDEAPSGLLGQHTEDAIGLGCAASLQGFVEYAIAVADSLLKGQPYELYFTGGGVRHLRMERLPQHEVRPHLVLEGLHQWAKEQL